MNFLGSNKPLVLVHSAMQPIKSGEAVDIMLSPQFYILKRESIPVRFHFQAKRLAPSILESLLPPERHFEYYVFKDGEDWSFIAYDPDEISHFLQSRDLAVERVSKLYFAQQSAERFATPVELDENEALSNIQHTATVVPKMLLPEGMRYQSFTNEFKPSSGMSFGTGSHSIIREKDAWIVSAIFIMFALMFAAEGMRYNRVIAAMNNEVAIMLKDYPALQSQYARENISQKYHKIDKEERRKREVLKGLSRLILPGVEIDNLFMDGKNFTFVVKCPDEKSVQRVLSLAKEKQYKVSRAGKENLVKIVGSL